MRTNLTKNEVFWWLLESHTCAPNGHFIIFVKISILIMDNTQTQSQYLAPKCEVFEVELEDFMKQTSYHYMGGPDD